MGWNCSDAGRNKKKKRLHWRNSVRGTHLNMTCSAGHYILFSSFTVHRITMVCVSMIFPKNNKKEQSFDSSNCWTEKWYICKDATQIHTEVEWKRKTGREHEWKKERKWNGKEHQNSWIKQFILFRVFIPHAHTQIRRIFRTPYAVRSECRNIERITRT